MAFWHCRSTACAAQQLVAGAGECLLQLWASWPPSVASWHCRSTAGAAQQLMAGACGVAVVLDSVGMAAMQLAECRLAAVPWSRGSRRAILARAVRPALGSRRSDPRVRVGLITCWSKGIAQRY
ncbi:hypothetical protein PR003_g17160 [Phytophthora rubi]|uniref:Uncharacterized protein n=1 Tax=Phytophthora rubi TaxID=129364 RepID=A0A6A4EHM7_9STRA|nr:hypothetical protein PR001_g16492 [Phytophthora rubi]KAE9322678.1 hypothetical protein PR003_g17160 [Phytophthora rubi]